MKQGPDLILHAEQAAYLDRTVPARDPLLARMEAFAAEHDHPISDPEVGNLLTAVTRMRAPRRIVEVGANIGYGAIVLGRAALERDPAAKVVSIEKNPETCAVARRYVEEAGLSASVEVVLGDALEVLAGLEGTVDLAYLDCVKEDYPRYLDLLLPRLARGSVVVADNVLWKGLVAKPDSEVPAKEMPRVAALREHNRRIVAPPFAGVILPLGDGIALATYQG